MSEELKPGTSERHFALREAHEVAAEEAYFEPRPAEDGAMQRRAFNAGFVRGFDAAEKVYGVPSSGAKPQSIGRTGREPELLQDACSGLSNALANKPDARLHAREAAAQISAAKDAA